jgi:hypothetical protein
MNKPTYEELAAQVEVLRGALEPFASTGLPSCVSREDYSVMQERVKDWFGAAQFKKAIEVYNQTPAACLAQVKADAVESAVKFFHPARDIDADALQSYADRIRQEVE